MRDVKRQDKSQGELASNMRKGKLIHDYAKRTHAFVHHVWLSIRLKNLTAGQKTN